MQRRCEDDTPRESRNTEESQRSRGQCRKRLPLKTRGQHRVDPVRKEWEENDQKALVLSN